MPPFAAGSPVSPSIPAEVPPLPAHIAAMRAVHATVSAEHRAHIAAEWAGPAGDLLRRDAVDRRILVTNAALTALRPPALPDVRPELENAVVVGVLSEIVGTAGYAVAGWPLGDDWATWVATWEHAHDAMRAWLRTAPMGSSPVPTPRFPVSTPAGATFAAASQAVFSYGPEDAALPLVARLHDAEDLGYVVSALHGVHAPRDRVMLRLLEACQQHHCTSYLLLQKAAQAPGDLAADTLHALMYDQMRIPDDMVYATLSCADDIYSPKTGRTPRTDLLAACIATDRHPHRALAGWALRHAMPRMTSGGAPILIPAITTALAFPGPPHFREELLAALARVPGAPPAQATAGTQAASPPPISSGTMGRRP